MLALILTFWLQFHSHQLNRLQTWDSMRVMHGQVVEVTDDKLILLSADSEIIRRSEYLITKESRFARKPEIKEYILVFYCPADQFIFGIIFDKE